MLHWKERRERAAFLALANGAIFHALSQSAPVDTVGEAVFNTGMSGYQEIVTDPSYAGQFVTLTAPEIGNYGCNPQDEESRGLFLNGLVIHELNEPSNFRSEESLADYLKRNGKPGIAGVDTRRLTLMLRDEGSQKAYLPRVPNRSRKPRRSNVPAPGRDSTVRTMPPGSRPESLTNGIPRESSTSSRSTSGSNTTSCADLPRTTCA